MYGIVKKVRSTKKRFGPAEVYKVPVQMTTRSQVLLLNSDIRGGFTNITADYQKLRLEIGVGI